MSKKKPFACPVCAKGFGTWEAVERHRKIRFACRDLNPIVIPKAIPNPAKVDWRDKYIWWHIAKDGQRVTTFRGQELRVQCGKSFAAFIGDNKICESNYEMIAMTMAVRHAKAPTTPGNIG